MTQVKKYAAVFGAGLLLAALLLASYGVGRDAGLRYAAENPQPPDTVTVIRRIPVRNPSILGVKQIKTILIPLPVRADSTAPYTLNPGDTAAVPVDSSAAVAVPIEQAYFHGDEYDAWVSGFRPHLDSIVVFQRTQTITTTTAPPPPSRWSFGVTAGPCVVWTGTGIAGGLGIAAGLQFRF